MTPQDHQDNCPAKYYLAEKYPSVEPTQDIEDQILAKLDETGLTNSVKQNALQQWNEKSFPISEKIHQEVLSLPMYGVLSDAQVEKIITTVNNY